MTTLDDTAPDTRPAGVRPRYLRAALIFACLTVSVTSTLGTPLIPTIADDFGVSLEASQWLLTVTLLVGVVATPVIGRLGDGPRREQMLLGTMGAVVVGSIVAATAHGLPQMLLGRGLQGIGYATVPLSISLAREHLSGKAQAATIAALSITVAVGAGLGFPVTGLIAQDLDFHAAFWFAAVFGTVALATVWMNLPKTRSAGRPVPMDLPGAILLGGGLTALLISISQAEHLGWTSPQILGLIGLGAGLLLIWIMVELKTNNPLVDLRVSLRPGVLGANVAALLMGIGLYTAMSLVNRLAQLPESTGFGFGADLVTTGLLLVPLSIGSLVSQPIARRLVSRFGIEKTLPAGCLLVAATLLILASSHSHIWEIGVTTAILGIGIGVTFATMPALIVASVPAERTGSATSLNQVLRSTGGAIGSAASATVLAAHTNAGSLYPSASGFTTAFVMGGSICVLAAIAAYLLMRFKSDPEIPVPESELEELMEEAGAAGGVGPSVFDGERVKFPVGAR